LWNIRLASHAPVLTGTRIRDAILQVKEILPAGDFTAGDAMMYAITEKRGFLKDW
jgi:hypothetical protein